MKNDTMKNNSFAAYWRLLTAEQKTALCDKSGLNYKYLSRVASSGVVGWGAIKALVKADSNITFKMFLVGDTDA